ncbi:hypothetical protein KWG64_09045 [Rahnella sp. PD12R]|uniref:hypothetical protein n=1 Tax=Rahnella sp. PD12R TaxID=2855688 RepID=UPI001C474A6A|nr:hypothetical protein [Rahnella sp. PD12R]MBV6818092.1 hypothetical protein [Rahnella sp. PD12R]
MVNEIEVEKFVSADLYDDALKKLAGLLNLDINDEVVPKLLFGHDVAKILASGASISDLEEILKGELSFFMKYVVVKMDIIKEDAENQEGNDDESTVVKYLPIYKDFLIIHLLEFFLLKNDQANLYDYLKKIRIPYSKKYSAQLRDIYNSLSEG